MFYFFKKLLLRRHPRFTLVSTNLLGFKILVPDKSSFLHMLTEIWEREIYRFKTVKTRPVIIDGGANIGLSIIYFKSLYPEAKIIAFEPDPEIFKLLKSNIDSAGLKDVTLINKALAGREGSAPFFSEGADGGRLAAAEDRKLLPVETISLQPFLDQPVDLLKLDIEGSEAEVLLDCRQKLSEVNNIFVEYHSRKDKPQELNQILSILKENGFRYYLESAGVRSPHPFLARNENLGYDLQLNIYGYR